MSDLSNVSIVKKMEIDRNHIDNFVLETEEGTKRTKEKFYREASEQRNSYIKKELGFYEDCLAATKEEIKRRFAQGMPQDKTEEYASLQANVDHLLDLVVLNSNASNTFKLKFDYIVSSITDKTSLEELNSILDQFINRMRECGVSLSMADFDYTMFTKQYMTSFLKHTEFTQLKETFEKIYFACPDIILQLKMNLKYILEVHAKELGLYAEELKTKEFQENAVDSESVITKYVNARQDVGTRIAMDEYYNTKLFLDGKKKLSDYMPEAPARNKNFDMFVIGGGSHSALDLDEKEHYDSAVMGLYLTVNELKKYYHYEPMITDLIARNKQKDSAKTSYLNKKKEIEKEEKNRQNITKEYLKATGVGLFARKNETKMQNAQLKMNEQVRKLHDLYEQLNEEEINYFLAEVSESASIYDLFLTALRSFAFLEKFFTTDEFFMENGLEQNIVEFLRFLYNPNNNFLRKINAFAEYNVTEVVAEKYKLLKLNVSSDIINSDNIDSTLESIRFINLIQNINRSTINFHRIENLCKMNEIIASSEEENEEEKQEETNPEM